MPTHGWWRKEIFFTMISTEAYGTQYIRHSFTCIYTVEHLCVDFLLAVRQPRGGDGGSDDDNTTTGSQSFVWTWTMYLSLAVDTASATTKTNASTCSSLNYCIQCKYIILKMAAPTPKMKRIVIVKVALPMVVMILLLDASLLSDHKDFSCNRLRKNTWRLFHQADEHHEFIRYVLCVCVRAFEFVCTQMQSGKAANKMWYARFDITTPMMAHTKLINVYLLNISPVLLFTIHMAIAMGHCDPLFFSSYSHTTIPQLS